MLLAHTYKQQNFVGLFLFIYLFILNSSRISSLYIKSVEKHPYIQVICIEILKSNNIYILILVKENHICHHSYKIKNDIIHSGGKKGDICHLNSSCYNFCFTFLKISHKQKCQGHIIFITISKRISSGKLFVVNKKVMLIVGQNKNQ